MNAVANLEAFAKRIGRVYPVGMERKVLDGVRLLAELAILADGAGRMMLRPPDGLRGDDMWRCASDHAKPVAPVRFLAARLLE